MKKVFAVALGLALFVPTVAVFADDEVATSTPMMGSGYSQCIPVTSPLFPSGWFCPNEQTRQRTIEILKARIAQLQAELASLLAK